MTRCAEPPSYRRRGRLVKRSPQEKLNPGDFSDRREQKEVITYARWKPPIGDARAEQLRDADETHFLVRDESEPFVN